METAHKLVELYKEQRENLEKKQGPIIEYKGRYIISLGP